MPYCEGEASLECHNFRLEKVTHNYVLPIVLQFANNARFALFSPGLWPYDIG